MTDFLRFSYDDFEDLHTAAVFDECSLWASRFGRLLLEHMPLRRDVEILDLACGTGFPLFELAHMSGASCRVTGLDNWKAGIERARARLRVYQLPNVEIVEADAAQLPFQDERFDLLVSNLGINNFHDPQAVVTECYRVAKPGASLLLTTNPIGHMREFYAVFREVVSETGNPRYLERLAENEAHRGSKEVLVEMLTRAGFVLATVKEDQFEMRYLDGSALLNHWLTKIGFLEGWRGVVDRKDEERVFSELERRLNERARREGELRMTVPMLYVEAEKSVGHTR
ncbi:MAG: methyltransferase domain-containing protein [Ktedonobacteraceae bacterium]|nr:methyltransferase domain-containing protein [Ktedonobacteraceae bacterium]